jgi:hypothetical protein
LVPTSAELLPEDTKNKFYVTDVTSEKINKPQKLKTSARTILQVNMKTYSPLRQGCPSAPQPFWESSADILHLSVPRPRESPVFLISNCWYSCSSVNFQVKDDLDISRISIYQYPAKVSTPL